MGQEQAKKVLSVGVYNHYKRVLALKAGANVVMPNLSPTDVRKKYLLYDNKICTGDESAQCRMCLQKRVEGAGYRIVESRGDHASFNERK